LIHYNMSLDAQVKQVARVKYHVHGLIQEPITIHPDKTIGEVLALIDEKGYQFHTFPVVNERNSLVGLLPGRVVKPRYASKLVTEAMLSREDVFTVSQKDIEKNPIDVADKFFDAHVGIHKLLVVDEEDCLRGLFTLSDIERINDEQDSALKPARDERFRLLCGAAIASARSTDGELDRDVIVAHVGRLVSEGLDVAAISTAHGFSLGVGEMVRLLREEFPDLTIIAGNVTSGEGVDFLADAGADAVKVGQGPGSICTTRIVAGVGVPQMTALYLASQASKKNNVRILADGGISKSGDVVKALTLADAVVCGSILAGCREAPGSIIEIDGKLYKQYRGMGSKAAMRDGSAVRYGHTEGVTAKTAAEGIEALKELSGSLQQTLETLVGGIQSGLGYLGAKNLEELKGKARYLRVSPASQLESKPHDVIEVKTGDKTS
ncbi:MAG: IMP dehydrogenase, partial [Opitutales bacterium]